MDNFRLIGIKALSECDKKYYKILQLEKTYHFYNNYIVDDFTDQIVQTEDDLDLYGTEGLNITISAIAGKNGSGKSSILELLSMIINNLSVWYKEMPSDDLIWIEDLCAVLYFRSDKMYKIEVNKTAVKILSYTEKKGRYTIIGDATHTFKLRDFCYTVAINYSQYALNAKYLGTWLNGLFHKNDGYQIPIVINPMRTEGNFDINTENSLVTARLLANLLRPVQKGQFDYRDLTDNTKAIALRLAPNTIDRSKRVFYTNWLDERLRYHAAVIIMRSLKKPSSKAASNFRLVSQLKSLLNSLVGPRPMVPP